MHRLCYQHAGTWFGDCMPVYADGAFWLFHQRDTRRPGPFGEPFGWALARTTDFVTYTDLGESLTRGGEGEQDQFVFAGSVFAAGGRFHAYYTGYNRDYPDAGKASQVLMRADSDDLIGWTKVPGELVAPQPGFDPDNWRDPFVLRDEENERWMMILGARAQGDPIELTGRTVWLTSTDLETWEFQGDFWAPGLYTMHEMPDLFRLGDQWYLLTTEYSDRCKTVYRSSPSLTGPWRVPGADPDGDSGGGPVDDAFDGRAYYAARSAADEQHRYLFGWVATKEGERDLGAWQWGGTLVVHEVSRREDGSLAVTLPGAVRTAFGAGSSLVTEPVEVAATDGQALLELAALPPDRPTLITMSVSAAARSVAIRLFGDDHGDGYAFTIRPGERRLDFDRIPNYPWFRYDNRGLERPFASRPGQRHRLDLLIDDTIAVLYLDGVALSVRMYEKPGDGLAVAVIDGTLTVHTAEIAVLPPAP